MSVNIGSTEIGQIYLGSTQIVEAYLGSTKVYSYVNPYNPLGLPQYTIRARFSGTPAATSGGGFSGTITNVSGDIYDIQTSNWNLLFGTLGTPQIDKKPVEVLGANSAGVTSMNSMFYGCSSVTSIPLMDTSSVTDMQFMFTNCTALTSAPLFNTSNVTNMQSMFSGCTALTTAPALSTGSVTNFSAVFNNCTALTSVPQYNMASATTTTNMFYGCTNVASGALDLYTSVSQQTTPPATHTDMFYNCGVSTTNGLAELEQIPYGWGGRFASITCKKYVYSSASTDLPAYSPRPYTGYLAGAIWVPNNDVSYGTGLMYALTTPSTARTMRVYQRTKFYRWDSSSYPATNSNVGFGAFAIPKADLSIQNVYGSYYGWKSSVEPQFLYSLNDNLGTAPTSGYREFLPPANRRFEFGSATPITIPADWAILLCLYIYDGSYYYFGTVAQNTYGYLPYSSDDLIVQVSNATPST